MTRNALHNNVYKHGGAMLVFLIFFLSLSLAITLVMTSTAMNDWQVSDDILETKSSYYLAEAGPEDIYYRLQQSMQADITEVLSVGSGQVTTTLTDLGGTQKQIEGISDFDNKVRNIRMLVTTASGTPLFDGVQVGSGGMTLGNSAIIEGSVYSNGSIYGGPGAGITGSVTAANNSGPLTLNEENDSNDPPAYDLRFGVTSWNEAVALSFQVTEDAPINKVAFFMKRFGTPANRTVKIVSHDNYKNNPSNTVLASGTMDVSQVTANYSWVEVVMTSHPILSAGETYWVVIDGPKNRFQYFDIAYDQGYSNGITKTGSLSVPYWTQASPSSLDMAFRIYTDGLEGTIDEFSIGEIGVGDAHAHTVINTNVEGVLHCLVGSGNNQSCDVSQGEPEPINLPISDGMIDQWKLDAQAGGTITGDYTPSGSSSILGPKHITGDLIIPKSHNLTIAGTVYVEGQVHIKNNSSLSTDSNYGPNSGIVVAGDQILFLGAASLSGSGQVPSYLLLLSESTCNQQICSGQDAIDMYGGDQISGGMLYAKNGSITISGTTDVGKLVAKELHLDPTATLSVDQGITEVHFETNQSNEWGIDSWDELLP